MAINCGWCGLSFEPKRTSQKYCCSECREQKMYQNQLERERIKRIKIRTCPLCGNQFTSEGRAWKRYCSQSCYDEAHKIAQKKWYEKNKDRVREQSADRTRQHRTKSRSKKKAEVSAAKIVDVITKAENAGMNYGDFVGIELEKTNQCLHNTFPAWVRIQTHESKSEAR